MTNHVKVLFHLAQNRRNLIYRGDLLVSLTTPLVEGIPSGMTAETIEAAIQSSPLMLLVRVILIYAASEKEPSICPMVFDAQELLDVLKLMPKLRNGGHRLFPRMLDCIQRLTTWTPSDLDSP